MKTDISMLSLLRIKPAALTLIGRYIKQSNIQQVMIVWSDGIKELVGQKIYDSLKAHQILITEEMVQTTSEIEVITKIATRIPKRTQAIVGIGGGKALDVAKTISFFNHLPFISVPTSLATDALASPTSSLTSDGRKLSLQTTTPDAVIVDTEIVANSPALLTSSGIGDILAKFTAINDWKLAYHKKGTPLNDFAVLISLSSAEHFAAFSVQDLHDQTYLRTIAGSLVMSGLASTIAHSSRPASGSEHLISHALDEILEKPHMHGLQVALGTMIAARLQNSVQKSLIDKVCESAKITQYWQTHKLLKADLIAAIKKAPTIKEDFYTILSEPSKIDEAIKLLDQDPLLKSFTL